MKSNNNSFLPNNVFAIGRSKTPSRTFLSKENFNNLNFAFQHSDNSNSNNEIKLQLQKSNNAQIKNNIWNINNNNTNSNNNNNSNRPNHIQENSNGFSKNSFNLNQNNVLNVTNNLNSNKADYETSSFNSSNKRNNFYKDKIPINSIFNQQNNKQFVSKKENKQENFKIYNNTTNDNLNLNLPNNNLINNLSAKYSNCNNFLEPSLSSLNIENSVYDNNCGTLNYIFKPTPFIEDSSNPAKPDANLIAFCVTADEQFQNKSLEELRYEDLQIKNSGKLITTIKNNNYNNSINNQNINKLYSNKMSGSGLISNIQSNNTTANTSGNQMLNGHSSLINNNQTNNNQNQNQSNTNPSLFGNNNNQSGIFGNMGNQAQSLSNINNKVSNTGTLGGSVIGASLTQNNPGNSNSNTTPGLFNASNLVGTSGNTGLSRQNATSFFSETNKSTNLFGSSTQTPGLFGTQTNSANTSLLGNNANNSVNTNSILSNSLFTNAQNDNKSGLNNTTTNSLFGNQTTNLSGSNTVTTSSLFNNNSNPTNTSTSLFTNLNNNLGQTGTQGTSLFGGTSTLTAPANNQIYNSLGNTNSGTNSLFGNSSSNTLNNPQNLNINPNNFIPQNVLGVPITAISPNVVHAIQSKLTLNDFIDLIQEQNNKRFAYHNYIYRNEDNIFDIYSKEFQESKKRNQIFKEPKIDYINKNYKVEFITPTRTTINNFSEGDSYLRHKRQRLEQERQSIYSKNLLDLNKRARYSNSKSQYSSGSKNIDNYGERSKMKRDKINLKEITDFRRHLENTDSNVFNNGDFDMINLLIDIQLDTANYNNNKIESFSLDVNKNNNVKLLKEAIIENIRKREQESDLGKLKIKSICLLAKGYKLENEKSINSYGLQDGSKVQVFIETKKLNSNNNKQTSESLNLDEETNYANKQMKSKQEKASLELIPNISNNNTVYPSLKEICNMTLAQLKNVENLEIKNEHGSILFKVPVNLVKMNLDKIKIEPNYISIYENNEEIPPKGTKFNLPCRITMNNCFPESKASNEEEESEFIESLRDNVHSNDGEWISYDKKSGVLVFDIPYWKKCADI